mmetsp:Transcript_114192/g.368933  ORF Transcript_114192/g.368933 Transcript_114192/m.368933 type:complete len:298 (+) Transcript_114192:1972-2865(+)
MQDLGVQAALEIAEGPSDDGVPGLALDLGGVLRGVEPAPEGAGPALRREQPPRGLVRGPGVGAEARLRHPRAEAGVGVVVPREAGEALEQGVVAVGVLGPQRWVQLRAVHLGPADLLQLHTAYELVVAQDAVEVVGGRAGQVREVERQQGLVEVGPDVCRRVDVLQHLVTRDGVLRPIALESAALEKVPGVALHLRNAPQVLVPEHGHGEKHEVEHDEGELLAPQHEHVLRPQVVEEPLAGDGLILRVVAPGDGGLQDLLHLRVRLIAHELVKVVGFQANFAALLPRAIFRLLFHQR